MTYIKSGRCVRHKEGRNFSNFFFGSLWVEIEEEFDKVGEEYVGKKDKQELR